MTGVTEDGHSGDSGFPTNDGPDVRVLVTWILGRSNLEVPAHYAVSAECGRVEGAPPSLQETFN